jgi:hypothetical protein
MGDCSRVLSGKRWWIAAAANFVILSAVSGHTVARAAQQDAQVNTVAAMEDFQKRLDAYLELREDLATKLEPLSPTADTSELTARQEALASAMKNARAGAKQGDLVPKPVAVQMAETVAADFRRRNAAAKQSALKEVPDGPRPVINRTYPAEAALPTVPPLLLAKLPTLPDNLQYRFFGRHIVILDGDLQIITDYIANALPPH